MGGLVDRAVCLGRAGTDTVDLGIRLSQLHKRIVPSEGSTNRGTHIVLSTTVLGREAVLATVDTTSDLDPTSSSVTSEVSRLNEALGEDLGSGGAGHVGLGTEGNGAVLVGGNVASDSGGQKDTEVVLVNNGSGLTVLARLGLGRSCGGRGGRSGRSHSGRG